MVKKLTQYQIDESIRMYNNGISSEKIAKKYNVSSVAIRGLLKRRNIKMRDYSQSKKEYKLKTNFFEKIDTEQKAYWLGFLSADGYYNIKNNELALNLQNKDKGHMIKFKKSLKTNHKIKSYSYKDISFVKISIKDIHFTKHLKPFFKKNKTFTLRFPKIEKELERHFIRGYFDGDGSINQSKKIKSNIAFTITSNKYFLDELRKRLLKINLNKTKYWVRHKQKPEIVTLTYCGKNNIKKLYDFLYNNSTIYLKRKKDKFEDILK